MEEPSATRRQPVEGSQVDPVRLYLHDIGRHSLLGPEDESHLGQAASEPAPQTLAYTNHLHASDRSYGELAAALLPCFWLYTDLGIRLGARRHDDHPYDDWLAMYGDPAFTAATARATEIADAAAREAGPLERARMDAAFARSMEHERDFFARA